MGFLEKLFIDRYKEGDIKVYRKVQIFTPVVSLIGVFSGLLALVMFFTGAIMAGGAVGFLVMSCVIVLFFIGRGWYSVAVSFFVYTLFVVMFLAIKFDQYQTVYETYVFATLSLFLLVVGGLISVNRHQIDILTFLGIGGVVALYLFDAFPQDNYQVTLLAVQSLVTSVLLVGVGGYFVRRIVILQQTLFEEGIRLSDHIQKTCEKTTEALGHAQHDIENISQRLFQSSQILQETSHNLQTFLLEVSKSLQTLSGILSSNAHGEEEVLAVQQESSKTIQTHLFRLEEGMRVLSQTMSLVQESASVAHERKDVLERLFQGMREVDGSLRELSNQVGAMTHMIQKLFEINALMGEIVEKTHMLGINASIEASHAGQEGKGFHVVAEEIRRLAQNAKQQSMEIGEFLKNIQTSMDIMNRSMSNTMGFFRQVQSEIQSTKKGLDETFDHLQSVERNTKTITNFLVDFSTFGNQVKNASKKMEEQLTSMLSRTREASEISQKVYEDTKTLKEHFVNLVTEATTLSQLSRENQEKIKRLREKIG